MNFRYVATLAVLCIGVSANAQNQQANFYGSGPYGQVAQVSGCSDPVCGCESGCCGDPTCAAPAPTCEMPCAAGPSCGVPGCGCDAGMGMGCDSGGCDSGGCDSGGGCPIGCGDCDLGDPFALFGECGGITAGGWVSIGYHDKNIPLFNSHAGRVNVHQTWLYAEKAADGSNGLGLGGRIDYVYGVDAQDTQAFGIADDHWDNDWDNGIYGHSIPQLYGEAAYGNMSVKFGHFYTIIGWEVVTAPDNFFYSHAYTMYNSEPFTHTGALATLTPSDDVTLWGGYVLGWDSGFEDNGSAFLGGVSLSLSEQLSLTYATVIGDFAEDASGVVTEEGYMHSIVADLSLSDNLQYILQSDLLDTTNAAGGVQRKTFGINNYLIYTVNDCLAVGGRYEWWNIEGANFGLASDSDINALTLGVNYKPHANVMVRPEVRWDWDDDLAIGLEDGDSQTTFGIDTIFLF